MTPTTTKAAAERERQAAFNATLKRLNAALAAAGEGIDLKALKRVKPAENAKLEAAEKRLNTTWLAAQLNMATHDEYLGALGSWEAANYRAFNTLKEAR